MNESVHLPQCDGVSILVSTLVHTLTLIDGPALPVSQVSLDLGEGSLSYHDPAASHTRSCIVWI